MKSVKEGLVMRKSIFFCEIRHLDRVVEGEFDSVFAQLKRLGIDGFQFSDRDIEKAGEERLLAALRRHEMHTDVIHIDPVAVGRRYRV